MKPLLQVTRQDEEIGVLEEELVKLKERHQQAEDQLKEYEAKQQQVSLSNNVVRLICGWSHSKSLAWLFQQSSLAHVEVIHKNMNFSYLWLTQLWDVIVIFVF